MWTYVAPPVLAANTLTDDEVDELRVWLWSDAYVAPDRVAPKGDQPMFAFASEPAGLEYTYFWTKVLGREMPAPLARLLDIARTLAPAPFNCAFVNYYRNGVDHVPPHCDKTHKDEPIVSFSFYQPGHALSDLRTFEVLHEGHVVERIVMEDRSALVMLPGMQELLQHSVPAAPHVQKWRLNVTFRVQPVT